MRSDLRERKIQKKMTTVEVTTKLPKVSCAAKTSNGNSTEDIRTIAGRQQKVQLTAQ
eukprot:m.254282 g.254282  ORF g.254282 m.254282 type:complete len:57 (+) comp17858_c0_seq1:1507-1677(+)